MTDFAPCTDELLGHNRTYATDFGEGERPVAPARRLAVVACMDSRLDIFAILGLENGDAHIIRNAGGVITDDVIRSLCLSQRFLGTREILLIHHTDCGMQLVSEDGFKAEFEAELGVKPPWALESFADAHDDVRQSMRRLALTPFLRDTSHVRGFVYDVRTGLLDEVDPPS